MYKPEPGGVNHCTITVPLKFANGDVLRILSLNCFSLRLKRDLMWEFISKTFQLMSWTMQMTWTESWLWATRTVRSLAVCGFIAWTEQRSVMRPQWESLVLMLERLLSWAEQKGYLFPNPFLCRGRWRRLCLPHQPVPVGEQAKGRMQWGQSALSEVLVCVLVLLPLQFWSGWTTTSTVLWVQGGLCFLEVFLVKLRSFCDLKLWLLLLLAWVAVFLFLKIQLWMP